MSTSKGPERCDTCKRVLTIWLFCCQDCSRQYCYECHRVHDKTHKFSKKHIPLMVQKHKNTREYSEPRDQEYRRDRYARENSEHHRSHNPRQESEDFLNKLKIEQLEKSLRERDDRIAALTQAFDREQRKHKRSFTLLNEEIQRKEERVQSSFGYMCYLCRFDYPIEKSGFNCRECSTSLEQRSNYCYPCSQKREVCYYCGEPISAIRYYRDMLHSFDRKLNQRVDELRLLMRQSSDQSKVNIYNLIDSLKTRGQTMLLWLSKYHDLSRPHVLEHCRVYPDSD